MMRAAALLMGALLLAGCASAPLRWQPPEIVRVTPPAALMGEESAPAVPGETATQRDVARYLVELHEWAERGWARVRGINEWAGGKND